MGFSWFGREGGEVERGARRRGALTTSPSVSQNERSMRVTTRPGDEGVPRWSSLGGAWWVSISIVGWLKGGV